MVSLAKLNNFRNDIFSFQKYLRLYLKIKTIFMFISSFDFRNDNLLYFLIRYSKCFIYIDFKKKFLIGDYHQHR